ncbi:SMP-30/gluconolactonase/LRE family protein [Paraburkholderia xenovorans]|uniref:SMP-30/gluconolactonase/LRE family protein n=1 Tax=Paraburkholderia xenovorans TaxID=36873 RepID=UPI0015598E22|nr:SMP-30/gluconolactonase/LRE family protein [Paraburkholderia xenovorans]NPT38735.1 SMP-30/gluconolactonase/LRE family protein [Paraburkholderia xenovorans]
MFNVPRIKTEVFASLPAAFRVTDHAEVRFGVVRDSFLEGPAFDREGNLYCVDIPYGRIFRITRSGQFELVCQYDGRPNGIAIHRDGRIFIADQLRGIVVLDPLRGTVEDLVRTGGFEPFRGPNDLIFNRAGELFFTDQGQTGLDRPFGCLYRLNVDGRLDRLLDNVPSPNGLALSPDERTLYLAVTRANAVWRVPLDPFGNGSVARVGHYLQLSGGTGPDGLASASDGSLAVAHIGLGAVWLFDRIGEPVARVCSCAGLQTSNVAFDPADSGVVYMTESESGQILRAAVPLQGARPYSHD